MCDIVWKQTPYNVTMGECSDYSGRVEFAVSRKCIVTLPHHHLSFLFTMIISKKSEKWKNSVQ